MKIAAALALALLLPRPQAEKVTLAWAPKQGDKLKSEQVMSMDIKCKITAQGQAQTMEMSTRRNEVAVYEVAEVVDGKLKKLVIDFEKDIEETQQPGAEAMDKKEGPLHGRHVTITEKGGELKLEGAEGLGDKEKKKLDLEPDKFTKTFPSKPVEIGESWEVSGAKVRELLGAADEDIKDGKISCTLKAVKEIDGRRCAVLSAELELKGKSGEAVDIAVSLTGEIIVLLDRGYTMSVRLKGKIVMTAENENMTLAGTGPMTVEVTGTLK